MNFKEAERWHLWATLRYIPILLLMASVAWASVCPSQYPYETQIDQLKPTTDPVYGFVGMMNYSTSNATRFNTTTCDNQIYIYPNGTVIPYVVKSTTGYCGNASVNTTFLLGLDLNSTNTTYYSCEGLLGGASKQNMSGLQQKANLSALYLMNSNASLVDSTGLNTLTIAGGAYITRTAGGIWGNSILFNTGYASASQNLGLPAGSNGSSEIVVFQVNGTGTGQSLYGYGAASARQMRILYNTGAYGYASYDDTLGSATSFPVTATGMWVVWQNIYNGTNREIYVNGTYRASDTAALNTGVATVAVGTNPWAVGGNFFNQIQVSLIMTVNNSVNRSWVEAFYNQSTQIHTTTSNEIPSGNPTPSLAPATAFYNTTIEGSANNTANVAVSQYNWTLYVNGSSFSTGTATNGTDGFAIGTTRSFFNQSGFTAGSILMLSISGNFTNGSTFTAVNSSNLTIQSMNATIDQAYITNNISLFAGNTFLQAATTLSTSEPTTSIAFSYSWFKNGANQTALAGSGASGNNTLYLINTTTPAFTFGDNWNICIYSGSNVKCSANSTVKNFSTSVSFNAIQYASIGSPNIFIAPINSTIADVNATLTVNGVAQTATKTVNATNAIFTSNYAPPRANVGSTLSAVWASTYSTTDGYIYTAPNSNYSFTVADSGFFLCNSSTNLSVMYSFIDSLTHAPINASLAASFVWTGDDSSTNIQNINQQNDTTQICIVPDSFNRQATVSEAITAAGYLTITTSRPAQNYSSANISRVITMINTSFGAYYTFIVINQYSAVIPNAFVIIRQGGVVVFNGTTDITGSVVTPLTQLQIYEITAGASVYQTQTFSFTSGATTTTTITLQATGTQLNLTSPNQVFNNTPYSVSPPNHYTTTPITIVYSVSSNNSSLLSWGWTISAINGTVFTVNSSTVSAGGTMSYYLNTTGVFNVNIWFVGAGFSNYTPSSYVYVYANSTGMAAAQTQLETGTVISGFGYYLIILTLAMMAALFVSQYTLDGAALVGLLVLWVGTMLWPGVIVTDFGGLGISTFMLTSLVSLVCGSVFYLKQYGS